jgi:hypothetical protein
LSLEFTDITCYLNTNPDLKLTDLKGKVKHVYFLTYTCINYINTVPYADDCYQKNADEDFTISGIHSLEFDFENDMIIQKKQYITMIQSFQGHKIIITEYSICVGNQYWLRDYLIDMQWFIKYNHIDEGDYEQIKRQFSSYYQKERKNGDNNWKFGNKKVVIFSQK